MQRKASPQTPSSESKENEPPRSNADSDTYSSSADSTPNAPGNETEGNPVDPHEFSSRPTDSGEPDDSGEEQSSEDMNDENREGSPSPEYPSDYIQLKRGPPDCQRSKPASMQGILHPVAHSTPLRSVVQQEPPYDDDDECDLYESIRIPEVHSSEESNVSRKRRAEDDEYYEFDWEDELRAERPHFSQPGNEEVIPMENRSHFLTGSESPMSLRFIRQMGLNAGIVTDRSGSPRYPANFDDIICEQRQTAEVFASSLQQKLEEVSKNQGSETVTDRDHCPSTDMNPPAHRESCIEKGSYIAIENNGRVVPGLYIDGTDTVMEVDILNARKIGWTSSKIKSTVDREKFICVLNNVESQPQPKSKSNDPLKVLIFSLF